MKKLIAHLSLSRKFILIGVIALLMAVAPAFVAVSAKLNQFRTAESEVAGIAPAGDAIQLLRLTQQHQGISAGYLAGNDGVKAQRESVRAEVDKALARALVSVGGLPSVEPAKRVEAMQRE